MRAMCRSAVWLACFGATLAPGVRALQRDNTTAVPSILYGTWIWSPESTIDPQLERYKCYVERLEPADAGKSRLREHRIRETGEVVKNDFQFMFGEDLTGRSGVVLFRLTGPRSYQIVNKTRDGDVTFVVTRQISSDGRTMTHRGEGTVAGRQVRNDQVFRRSDGPARSGDCAVDLER